MARVFLTKKDYNSAMEIINNSNLKSFEKIVFNKLIKEIDYYRYKSSICSQLQKQPSFISEAIENEGDINFVFKYYDEYKSILKRIQSEFTKTTTHFYYIF